MLASTIPTTIEQAFKLNDKERWTKKINIEIYNLQYKYHTVSLKLNRLTG